MKTQPRFPARQSLTNLLPADKRAPQPRGRWRTGLILTALWLAGAGALAHDVPAPPSDFVARASAGDPQAQYQLGQWFTNPTGPAPDYEKAAAWYRKAARQNLAPAQYQLGRLHAQGLGVEPSPTEAARWFGRAARQGYAPAQTGLGRLHARGQGVRKSHPEALKWFRRAAAQGDRAAQNFIGRMYELGHGVPKDPIEAYRWYTLAAQDRNPVQARANRTALAGKMNREDLARAEWRSLPLVAVFDDEP